MAAPNQIDTPASLLLRLRDSTDKESWRIFVEVYGPLIRGYCRHRGLQEADAADASQEVLIRIAKAIGRFEYQPERGRFRDWLGTVSRNAVKRYQERNRQQRGKGGEDRPELDVAAPGEPDPEWTTRYQSRLLAAACDRVRDRFEPHTWRAFEGVWLERRSAQEVAAELGLPLHNVYVAKSRVIQKLREELKFLAEDIPHSLPAD